MADRFEVRKGVPINEQAQEPTAPPPRQNEPPTGEPQGEAQAEQQPRDRSAPTHRRPTRSIALPARRSALRGWIVLACLLAMAAPLLLLQLQGPNVRDTGEAVALSTSIQTWQYQQRMETMPTFSEDRLVPYYNDEIQWRQPPGVTWLHLAAFHLGADDRSSTDHLIWLGRLTGAGMALLAMLSIFWAGHSIGGLRTATLAALVCLGSPLWLYDARLAEPAMVYVAWSLLSIAAALWAIRPLKPPPSIWRQGFGWMLCGTAMAAAVLCVGPGGFAGCCLPILVMLFICPNRLSHSLGLVAALLIAVLMVMPWAVYAHLRDPAAWPTNMAAWVPSEWMDPGLMFSRGVERLGLALLVLMPWTLWLIAGVVQPFSHSSEGARAKLFLGLGWFAVAVFIFLGSTSEGGAATLLAVIPAGAIVFAELFEHYRTLADMGRYARFWRIMRWTHIFVLICVTMLVPTFLWIRPTAIPDRFSANQVFGSVHPVFVAGVTAALALMLVLSIRWAAKHHPVKAALAWCLWGIMLLFSIILPVSTGPVSANPLSKEGEAIAGVTHGSRLFYLIPPNATSATPSDKLKANPILVLYANQSIPAITQAELEQVASENPEFYVLARRGTTPPLPGMTPSLELAQVELKLWRFGTSM